MHPFCHDSQFHPSDSEFELCTIVKTSLGVHNIFQRFMTYKSNSKLEIYNTKLVHAFWRLEEQRRDTTFEQTQIRHVQYNISTSLLQSNKRQSRFKYEAINKS
uniref:Uncharacterized protein n=1 Tax=Proboscia inermis TaxID=420281 RepID=A0A7S0GEN1_9STRA